MIRYLTAEIWDGGDTINDQVAKEDLEHYLQMLHSLKGG